MGTGLNFEFISLIEEHSALWKKEDKDFINRDVRKKLLSDVGDKLGLTEEECRRKLKNLKDKMREICYKLPKMANGLPAFHRGEEYVRWPYFKPLLFMKDQFINRDTKGAEDQQTEPGVSATADDHDELTMESNEEIHPQSSLICAKLMKRPKKRGVAIQQTRYTCSSSGGTKRKRRLGLDGFDPRIPNIPIERDDSDIRSTPTRAFVSEKRKDEWDAFAESICHDLRKITNPYYIVSVKSGINRLIGETVLKQLAVDNQHIVDGEGSHCVHETANSTMDETTGQHQLPTTSSSMDLKTEVFS